MPAAQPRFAEHGAERIDIAAKGPSAHQCRLDQGRAAPHEGVVDDVSSLGQALDKEARQLRLEAGPVRHLMQPISGPLLARPELVGVGADGNGMASCGRGVGGRDRGGLAC